MLNVFTLANGRLIQEEIESPEALAKFHPIWVDLESPTPDEKSWIKQVWYSGERIEKYLLLPKRNLYWILFCRLVLDGIAGVQFIFQGKFKHCWAILKAHFSFYALFSVHYKKRNKVQLDKYYKVESIVYQYYVKAGKVFEK